MSVAGPLARATAEEWVRLQSLTKARPLAREAEPCAAWQGPERLRFRGKRWIPRRLFFMLAGHDEAEIEGKTLVPRCLTRSCVSPGHQEIVPYKPPTLTKKRKTPDAEPPANPLLDAAKMARVRAELLKLQATLARIDAAEAAMPEELRGTDEGNDILMRAMGDHGPATDLVPDTPDMANLPAAFAANPLLTLFGNVGGGGQ